MRLIDLQPRFFDVPGVGGAKDGATFLCPCGPCAADPGKQVRLAVQFANPIGSEPRPAMTQKEKIYHVHALGSFDVPPGFLWQRTGEEFESMSFSPSVDASAAGHWHGFVTNGDVR